MTSLNWLNNLAGANSGNPTPNPSPNWWDAMPKRKSDDGANDNTHGAKKAKTSWYQFPFKEGIVKISDKGTRIISFEKLSAKDGVAIQKSFQSNYGLKLTDENIPAGLIILESLAGARPASAVTSSHILKGWEAPTHPALHFSVTELVGHLQPSFCLLYTSPSPRDS